MKAEIQKIKKQRLRSDIPKTKKNTKNQQPKNKQTKQQKKTPQGVTELKVVSVQCITKKN